MNLFSRIVGAAVLMLIASASAAVAQSYNFTFTGNDGMDATGTINIVGGVAQTGSINVTGVPVEADPSMLISASGSLVPDPITPATITLFNYNGDQVTYDDQVDLSNNPLYLDGDGLGFGSGQYSPMHYSTLIGINGGDVYGNIPPYTYTLFVGEAELDGNGNPLPGENEYVYTSTSGNMTLTPAPEPTSLGLVSTGLLGLFALRRRKA